MELADEGGAAAHDEGLMRGRLAGGMDCLRIHCAYDEAEAWAAMIGNRQRATHEGAHAGAS